MKLMTVLRIVFLYLLAVLVATLLGSLVQTQFNLAALQAMGVPVDGTTRLHSSLHDLRFFSPFLAVMVAACLLLATGWPLGRPRPAATWPLEGR